MVFNPFLSRFLSSVSCVSTPDSAGKDTILSFSLPLSNQTTISEDVFNPEKTETPDVAKESAKEGLKEEKSEASKTELEDSLYEECEVDGLRYVPPERYVDVRSYTQRDDGQFYTVYTLSIYMYNIIIHVYTCIYAYTHMYDNYMYNIYACTCMYIRCLQLYEDC